ncbi:MAG: SlyX family protein [Gammaproteobacteria bacterium]|nr:SlyX family protein [Gammaproteobacteria bacterium]MDH4254478.1 SlyX family protein [Gammaproteobacteria bacterium]MDH5309082.1 SlyX family protein [Gammaproteobacteria bacterium]
MDEERLIAIESKLAHQEVLLEELNAVLTNQQARVGYLEDLCRTLMERLRGLTEGATPGAPVDERPPHY